MSETTNRSGSWKKYAYEMLSIILGVLVALAVDEWREDRQHAERAEIALNNIRSEMETNLRILNVLHPSNEITLEYLQQDTLESDSLSDMKITPGIMLQDVAWNTLLNNGISTFIEYDELLKISQLYALQAIYKDFGNQFIHQLNQASITSTIMGNALSQDELIKSNPELFSLVMIVESQLIELLNDYLNPELE